MKKPFLLFLLVLVSASVSCTFDVIPDYGKKSYYIITNGADDTFTCHGKDLAVFISETAANKFINSRRIIFTESPLERSYYQLAYWVEPPPKTFSKLLLSRLETCGLFRNVSRPLSLASADLELNTEIVEFYHDISKRPGEVLVEVRAELIDLKKRSVVASRKFSVSAAVKKYSAEGAVISFSHGVSQVLTQIIQWLDSVVDGKG